MSTTAIDSDVAGPTLGEAREDAYVWPTASKGFGSFGYSSATQMRAEISSLLGNIEELLQKGKSLSAEAHEALARNISEQVERAKVNLGNLTEAASRQAQTAVDDTQAYIEANPWRAVGIAASVGALLGILISHR